MLVLEADRSPGRHDTQYGACDPRRYEMLGATGPHRSCATNLEEALVDFGGLLVPTPQPFNVFMEVDVSAEGELSVLPATSQPGDSLDFLAVMDLIVVLSSCPMDINPISSGGISEIFNSEKLALIGAELKSLANKLGPLLSFQRTA